MRYTFVVALVSYLDVKSHGFSPVIDAITNDLVNLENGISITTKNGKVLKIKAKKMSFVADNLAYHAVFGFNENFSSGMCCEECFVPQSKLNRNLSKFLRKMPKSSAHPLLV